MNTEKLISELLKNVDSGEPVSTNLETSERILTRVTDGIYREPWSAFRELIANSYDADAEKVYIETGAPEFDKIVVRDDGNGMSPQILAHVVKNIGGSSKRTIEGQKLQTVNKDDPDLSPSGRPLIGKIGIGLFAVAQLTQHFQIISKCKGSEFRSSATILLNTHDEKNLKKVGDKYIAGFANIITETVSDDEIEAQGTEVILYSLRSEIRRSMQSYRTWNASLTGGVDGEAIAQKPSYHIGVLPNTLVDKKLFLKEKLPWKPNDTPREKFNKIVDAAMNVSGRKGKPANLSHFDEYFKMIWKLSLSLPIDYIDRHPFDFSEKDKVIVFDVPGGKSQSNEVKLKANESVRDRFKLTSGKNSSNFVVFVDDIFLRRPIKCPNKINGPSRVKKPLFMVSKEKAPFEEKDLERAGGPLEFEAYLYWNSKIIPKDTAGVLIRVKEASGTLFDPTFLNYQVSEQNRLSKITAEIFVKEGLDSAVNIDRESFNYSHPHYLYIQRWLHKALRLFVNRQKGLAKSDLEREKEIKNIKRVEVKNNLALSIWKNRYGDTADPPVDFNQAKGKLIEEVGDSKISWTPQKSEQNTNTISAVAVVLEAYGALSHLSANERAKLIEDIVSIFKE